MQVITSFIARMLFAWEWKGKVVQATVAGQNGGLEKHFIKGWSSLEKKKKNLLSEIILLFLFADTSMLLPK